MGISTSSDVSAQSPQKRGRELASQGKKLWAQMGSVKAAATELMSRYPEVPSLQAFRYAAGLSQDHAAARYNEVTGNQTSLGGTTINAWESWARVRGNGSPPSISSLLILCSAYGRGPMGISDEEITPADLIAEVSRTKVGIEDQLVEALQATDLGSQGGQSTLRRKFAVLRPQARTIDHYARSAGFHHLGSRSERESEINYSCRNSTGGRWTQWTTCGMALVEVYAADQNLGSVRRGDAKCWRYNEAGSMVVLIVTVYAVPYWVLAVQYSREG
ncbi:hypothetical protein JOF29_004352 [Kribbella aluminosa]|uniref:Helix-turn-helix protein n=1 Tax=Kribbella aluminosa TaxID=416017 RepID=A0ABS4UNR6_9ACTN|nr:hypothetical protein [Kribbella aluminosa]